MKKILSFIVAASALAVLACSCNKDKYGTYDFITNTIVSVSSKERSAKIVESIFSDTYFSTKHSYTGTFSEATTKAADEFDSHIKSLDEDFIKGQLLLGESVSISLWSMDPGQCWLTYRISANGADTDK